MESLFSALVRTYSSSAVSAAAIACFVLRLGCLSSYFHCLTWRRLAHLHKLVHHTREYHHGSVFHPCLHFSLFCSLLFLFHNIPFFWQCCRRGPRGMGSSVVQSYGMKVGWNRTGASADSWALITAAHCSTGIGKPFAMSLWVSHSASVRAFCSGLAMRILACGSATLQLVKVLSISSALNENWPWRCSSATATGACRHPGSVCGYRSVHFISVSVVIVDASAAAADGRRDCGRRWRSSLCTHARLHLKAEKRAAGKPHDSFGSMSRPVQIFQQSWFCGLAQSWTQPKRALRKEGSRSPLGSLLLRTNVCR